MQELSGKEIKIGIKEILFCFFCICFSFSLQAQPSLSELHRQGDAYFEKADYRNALRFYKQAGTDQSTDKKVRLRVAITMYEANEVDGALAMLLSLNNEGKTDPEVFFYMARCYEAKNLFSEAIGSYKKYLQREKKQDVRTDWIKDQMFRCANGSRMKYGDESAYVENAGEAINTAYNEFGVKDSPTNLGKIYFNSNRDPADRAPVNQKKVNIYSAALVNGQWTDPTLLPTHINTGPYQQALGFSSNGQILYYLIQQANQFRIRTDTFSGMEDQFYKGYFNGPFDVNRDGTDITFFNDSICLYASNKPGGFGGFDIYVSFLNNGSWSAGTNLGPVINSFYDDRFPFLTRNGLTLFYSSNNLRSMGGFDVFKSSFDPTLFKWSVPENLGVPINSAGNDTYLIVAADGTNAYLTSDRKEGMGGEDIYRVFFKQPIIAHQEISDVPTFQQLLQSQDTAATIGDAQELPPVVKEYYVSHLFLEENADVLSPQNLKKLDLLANMMLIYPKIKAELSCFEIPSGQQIFSLYFSIKKAEEAGAYLVKKGIARDRIILKGYGPSFPLVLLPMEATPNTALYKKLNYRMEISLHDYETEPVIVHMENIQPPENIADPKGQKFLAMRHGLYYSVQIASITQILQNPNLEGLEEVFIDVDNTTGHYVYMVGLNPTYNEASAIKSQMVELGYADATIIPYLDGIRLDKAHSASLTASYPDLLIYLESEGK